MTGPQIARIKRTRLFFEQRDAFKSQIVKELTTFVKKCDKLGMNPAVRMNGTSDIVWEKVWPELFTLFPTIIFYDYTKHVKRCLASWTLPRNYHLTFSRSETNDADCLRVLADGIVNVAAVFSDANYPSVWFGVPTYSADNSDLRFLDPKGGHVGGLYAKGPAKKDTSGFVIPTNAA